MGDHDRGSGQAVASAARHAACITCHATRRSRMGHGCVRANLPAGRVHPGDQTGPCGLTGVCAARRARGRRHFHLNFIFNPDDPHEFAEIKDLNGRLVRRAYSCLEAHVTGEHGIGLGKIDYLTEEHGKP